MFNINQYLFFWTGYIMVIRFPFLFQFNTNDGAIGNWTSSMFGHRVCLTEECGRRILTVSFIVC